MLVKEFRNYSVVIHWFNKGSYNLLQQSVDSAVDCVNAEIEIFLSLWRNATVHCGIRTGVNGP